MIRIGYAARIIPSPSLAQWRLARLRSHSSSCLFSTGFLVKSKLLYLGAIAEARHLVANRRSARIPLPTIRQYADAQLIVFLVVDDGAGDRYDLAAGFRGEAHPVAGIKGRLLTLAHFCVSMMERGLPHPPANLR